ncbi:putative formamidopyrimidine-DNA glycosylase [Tupanvirus soda lake]|uniref:Formamidopyrimidine-DNA glycosylase n=2 Tax=Tupanvirus TaxID=2094720 RepID=A0AC62ABE7_9VIRU|nr:putative formamidopyrimidine-DNA glycosylase [Tupanvirus soda lake]QKU35064.1 putative formamidopyrimidine-DNA glycosylase [Tupanvirus soda lake]
MPEIAEIALTSEILEKYLKNKTLLSFDFTSGRFTKKSPVGYDEFVEALPLKVRHISSRGKFLWFELYDPNDKDDIWYIWNTFGLTGMWSFFEPKHTRAVLTLKNDLAVYFSDMRNFGTFRFSKDKTALDKKLDDLSPDFLKDDDFDISGIQKYKIPIVKILMDQTKVGSGLGNYLVAEILYRAKISPHRLGSQLSDDDIDNLTYWIKYVVKLSYIDNHIGYMVNLEEEANKITRKKYHPDIKLKDKTFKFMVYRQKTDPLGNKVKIDKIVGTGDNKRSTYWVPAVQK